MNYFKRGNGGGGGWREWGGKMVKLKGGERVINRKKWGRKVEGGKVEKWKIK